MTTEASLGSAVRWIFGLLWSAALCNCLPDTQGIAGSRSTRSALDEPKEGASAASATSPVVLSDEILVARCEERELVLRPKERVECARAAERLRAKQASAGSSLPVVSPVPAMPVAPVAAAAPVVPAAPPVPSAAPAQVATAPASPAATTPTNTDSVADEVAARALYQDGLALMEAKNYAKACPKLEESYRLKANVNVEFFLAECYERVGRTASAWLHFGGAASKAQAVGQKAKAEQARSRATALEPKLTRLTIRVQLEVPGLEVRRAGTLVTKPQWDSPIPVDPGPLKVTATAPGRQSFFVDVNASQVGVVIVTVPPLAVAP